VTISFEDEPKIRGIKVKSRYDIVVQGIMFAADTSKRYRDGTMYVNVRLNKYGKCWGARHRMFTGNTEYPFVHSKKNVTCFVVDRFGQCRPADPPKEKVLHLSDKTKVDTDWKPFAAALKARVEVNQ